MDLTTTPTVLDATKLDDYTRLRDACRALLGATCGIPVFDGGDLDAMESSTSFVTLRNAYGDPGVEVDGTWLSLMQGVGGVVYLEVIARRVPGGASITLTVDLYNVTTGAAVASSEVAISLTSDAAVKQKSSNLTLASGVNNYRARIKTSGPSAGAARVRLVVKGN